MKALDFIIPTYHFLEYGCDYAKSTESLHQWAKDETVDDSWDYKSCKFKIR